MKWLRRTRAHSGENEDPKWLRPEEERRSLAVLRDSQRRDLAALQTSQELATRGSAKARTQIDLLLGLLIRKEVITPTEANQIRYGYRI